MWYAFESKMFGEIGKVVQQLNDAAIIGLEKGFQGQCRKQLMLCKIFA